MKNIKTWLIHKLGGFTEEECLEQKEVYYIRAKICTLRAMKEFADFRYGKDWRGSMYQFILSDLDYWERANEAPDA